MKAKIFWAAAVAAVLCLSAAACSSDGGGDAGMSSVAATATTTTSASAASATSAADGEAPETDSDTVSVFVRFTAGNGEGSVTVSGESPVAVWFSDWPGEILELPDADVSDDVSVVEELVSFWFFRDENSGDTPPSIFVSDSGDITDSMGARYVVEAQLLPPAPVAETTTTTSSAAATSSATTSSASTSSVPEASEASSTATSSTTTTTSSTTTTTTTTVAESPAVLQVQVLNGSGVAGAAGRITAKLADAGYVVLPAGDAERRYSTSAVYYQRGHAEAAAEILAATGIEEIENPEPMPPPLAAANAPAVIVLLGEDTAPAAAAEQADLRPQPRSDVSLPLPDSVPRDSYVPGLADIQIFSAVNDQSADTQVLGNLDAISSTLNVIGRYSAPGARLLAGDLREGEDYAYLQTLYENLERAFAFFGFTPQNVCGAPAGYSFTDLLKPVREWNEQIQTYSGDAIFTTDRLLELHGGQRIDPEESLEFYVGQAAQTAHDSLRLAELLDETEAPQLVLCQAWIDASGELPEFANAAYYALLTPGIQPQESLLSQGTYHVKEISRNGNIADVVLCHPALGEQQILLHWREAGYRAEVTNARTYIGCQAAYERETYIAEDTNEDTFMFSFGERVFSAGDLLGFPRG